ncbi:hypothetical protein PVAP13_8NG222400 [Panicum virgatum]|uniref:Uncharacterized protein n=1 Tax=Panicum virgatum TaxID=38727 RepID=A0A8T0PEX0_PANVG|nr:hypothetical protein PVAP13_8NG222400 [Panicum virgatum]
MIGDAQLRRRIFGGQEQRGGLAPMAKSGTGIQQRPSRPAHLRRPERHGPAAGRGGRIRWPGEARPVQEAPPRPLQVRCLHGPRTRSMVCQAVVVKLHHALRQPRPLLRPHQGGARGGQRAAARRPRSARRSRGLRAAAHPQPGRGGGSRRGAAARGRPGRAPALNREAGGPCSSAAAAWALRHARVLGVVAAARCQLAHVNNYF